MKLPRWIPSFAAIAFILIVASGCAAPPKPASTAEIPAWSGRLSIKIDPGDIAPAQQISAGFTLKGQASAGELELFTPLGGKAAQLTWGKGFAVVDDGKLTRNYPNLSVAVRELTGADIPLAQLFDWLQAKQNKALEASMGWEADLTRLADGRLFVQRLQPLPRIELRVVLEQ